MSIIGAIVLLVLGGIATSYAEYHFQYNLFDLLEEKLFGVEHAIKLAEAKLAALKAKL